MIYDLQSHARVLRVSGLQALLPVVPIDDMDQACPTVSEGQFNVFSVHKDGHAIQASCVFWSACHGGAHTTSTSSKPHAMRRHNTG